MNCQHCNGTNLEDFFGRIFCMDCKEPASNTIDCAECDKTLTVDDSDQDDGVVTIAKVCDECYKELLGE